MRRRPASQGTGSARGHADPAQAAGRIGRAVGLALLAAGMLACGETPTAGSPPVPSTSGRAATAAQADVVAAPLPPAGPADDLTPIAGDSIARLRVDAAMGSTDASAALAARLLDRFERDGRRDDLFEAVQWTARDWDETPYLRSGILQRVVQRHCDDAVLRWHWLCVGGE